MVNISASIPVANDDIQSPFYRITPFEIVVPNTGLGTNSAPPEMAHRRFRWLASFSLIL